MCVLLPKVSIFISLGGGVPVDIKRATTNLNMLRETMLPSNSRKNISKSFSRSIYKFPPAWNRFPRE